MTEQNFTAWLEDNQAELTDIIGAARAGFAGGYAVALEQIGAGGVGDVSPVRDALSSRPVPQWFDEPFIAEGLQSMGLQSPTPREFGETIARRYVARIKELEEALSSRPVQGGISGWSIERASDDRIRVKAPDGMAWSFIDADDVGGCNQFVYRLLSALLSSAPAREQWQPIETAPKDGRKLLLTYKNSAGLPRIVVGGWVTDEEAAETDEDGVGLEAGWYERIDNWGDYYQVSITEGEPTHWMPLPAAPSHGICKE